MKKTICQNTSEITVIEIRDGRVLHKTVVFSIYISTAGGLLVAVGSSSQWSVLCILIIEHCNNVKTIIIIITNVPLSHAFFFVLVFRLF